MTHSTNGASVLDGGSRRGSTPSRPEGYNPPKRRPSATSSIFSVMSSSRQPKDKPEEERNKIAVYDPLDRKLWIDTKEKLKEMGESVRVPIKGTDTKVSVYMEMDGSANAKIFIAAVDLGKLGKWVKTQRKKGRMQHLYVLGQAPMGLGSVVEED